MFDDVSARVSIARSLAGPTVPEIDLAEIRRRAARVRSPAKPAYPRFAAAGAAALLAVGVLTGRAPAVVGSIEERLQAALAGAGIGPGVHVLVIPANVENRTGAMQVSFAQARLQADFALVAPAGLPPDIAGLRIFSAPLAVWSQAKQAWSIQGRQITFRYTRRNGRSFDLTADRFSPHSGPVPRFMYEADVPNARHGEHQDVQQLLDRIVAHPYEHFAWRNGTQELAATVSDALSADEIVRIRTAMNGIELPSFSGKRPGAERTVRYYRLPAPPSP